MEPSNLLAYETKYWNAGLTLLAGADEAGRGPLAGPVYAAAVILRPGTDILGLTDSKKLSEKKREYYFDVIRETALSYAIASVDQTVIDKINILKAAHLAIKHALEGLSPRPEFALIDGNSIGELCCERELIVKGDAKSLSIAAASVLAKVARDRFMLELDKQYPQYGFAKHKGYPTKAHYEAIAQYGPCPAHRTSFRLYRQVAG